MAEDDIDTEANQQKPGLLKDQVRLIKRRDSARLEIATIQDSLSFEKGFFKVIRALQLLAQRNEGIILAGLAGPSGAGKTVLTEKIQNFMPSVAVLSMDNYNDSSRIVDGNFDDPRLTDYETLLKNVEDLRAGKTIQVPVYDFKTSARVGYRTLEVPSSRIVIIEGIYALSEKLRPLLDLRISVTGGVHFDLVKRVLRDIQRAGQEPEEIIHQISETVYPMYKAFIEPDLQTAHIKIINKFNPFTGFQNPTYILKSSRNVAVDQIKSALSGLQKESLEEIYDIYLLPPGEDPQSCQSYLRMRNKEGKYSLMFEENAGIIVLFRNQLKKICVATKVISLFCKKAFDVYIRDDSVPRNCQFVCSRAGAIGLGTKFLNLIKEWVTDTPFVISPRITFEVSVRLLGGLMALGYTIATILKRRSHVLCDDRVCIKIDWLEQLNRQYIQVQGKDRVIVKSVADLLGLEGSYTPRTYIEQIQLEKLVNEVMALPEDLKTKLSLDEDVRVSPRDMLSRASADRVAMRSKHQKSHGMSHSYSSQRDKSLSKLTGFAVGNSLYGDRTSDSRTMLQNQAIVTQLSEQISSLNDRMDEFTSRIEELNINLTVKKQSSSQQNVGLHADTSMGPAHTYLIHGTRNGFVKGHVMPSSTSLSQLAKESPLMEEISAIARGQRQVMHQLDSLSNFIRGSTEDGSCHLQNNRQAAFDVGHMKVPLFCAVALGGLGIFLFRGLSLSRS